MRELGKDLRDQIRNRNLASEFIAKEPLPIKFDLIDGTPIRDWKIMNRMFNAVSPVQINVDRSTPGRVLLWNSNYDMRLSTTSAPDGLSLKDSPEVRSLFQQAIGKQNLESKLDKLAARPDVQASVELMQSERFSGKDPMKSYLHNDLIRSTFKKAKLKAWASIEKLPEVQELLQQRKDKRLGEIESRRKSSSYNFKRQQEQLQKHGY